MAALRGGTISALGDCSPRARALQNGRRNDERWSPSTSGKAFDRLVVGGQRSSKSLHGAWRDGSKSVAAVANYGARAAESSFVVGELEPKFRSRKLGQWRRRVSDCRASSSGTPGNGRRPPSPSAGTARPSRRSPPRSPPASRDGVELSRQTAVREEWSGLGAEGELERFFATCSPGLEEVVAAELRSAVIGATRVQIGSAGVSFQGTKRTGVLANLWLRSATRVLLELASGLMPARATRDSKDSVYDFVRQAADWPTLLVDDSNSVVRSRDEGASRRHHQPSGSSGSDGEKSHTGAEGGKRNQFQRWKFRTFSFSSRVRDCDGVTSSMFASTRAKDAVCDAVKDACGGSRPNPPEDGGASADVPLFLSLFRDHAVLYRDMTGLSLHKRGYRDVMHKASLNESVAAAMLTLAGWNRGVQELQSPNKGPGLSPGILMDPMCGSGTLLIEAALMALNSAPGLMRSRWPFESWHDFQPSLLQSCRQDAIAAEISAPKGLRLLGNDIHEGALSLFKRDAEAANVRSMLELSCRDCRDYLPSVTPSLVVVNPPWGARLGNISDRGDDQSLLTTWQVLGRFLKTHCSHADVYVLSGNSTVTHAMHMRADKKWPINLGGTDCRIMHYHVLPPKDFRTLESSAAVPHLSQ